jgi:hypothetical protein
LPRRGIGRANFGGPEETESVRGVNPVRLRASPIVEAMGYGNQPRDGG